MNETISGSRPAFIAGEWQATAATFPVYSPATEEKIADVVDCSKIEALQAIEASIESFGRWKHSTAFERATILRRWYELMIEQENELARCMAQEMGKPIRDARGEVRYAASFVSWYAEEATRIDGTILPSQFAHKRLLVQKQPVGPVLIITPWNFPAAMITRKASPALAAGCTIIVKPAEQAPLTALLLAQLWEQAGGPSGTLQVLPTSHPIEFAEPFFQDERIRKLSFTGSTEVGKHLAAQAAHTLKKVSLELGGHAPFLIFEDAEIEKAVRETVACKFRNAGQTCVCTNRIYVHEKIKDDYVAAFTKAVKQLRQDNPLLEETDIGPVVDQQGLKKVQEHVQDALDKGAQLVTGGRVSKELFYEPTILTNVQPGMRILEEETFGPVAPILTFSNEQEAIQLANATPYGLAAYFWTRDMARTFRVAEALDYGIIGVNDGLPSTAQAPFGGVKASGYGREGGTWGLDEYLTVKYISLSLA